MNTISDVQPNKSKQQIKTEEHGSGIVGQQTNRICSSFPYHMRATRPKALPKLKHVFERAQTIIFFQGEACKLILGPHTMETYSILA